MSFVSAAVTSRRKHPIWRSLGWDAWPLRRPTWYESAGTVKSTETDGSAG